MLTIHTFQFSVPGLKVIYTANALGISYEINEVNLKLGEGQSPEHLKLHPAGKVPVITDGDFTLFESNAICRYLASKT